VPIHCWEKDKLQKKIFVVVEIEILVVLDTLNHFLYWNVKNIV
jgi:hypothetical protein